MPAGRPSRFNMTEKAEALRNWSKKDGSTALCQFCVEQDIGPDLIYDWRDKSEEFAEELKKAKMRIATRLRQLLHDKKFPYNYGLFMSEIGYHDKFHHDYTESIKNNDAARKRSIEGAKQTTYNILVPHDLSIGANISASTISDPPNQSSE